MLLLIQIILNIKENNFIILEKEKEKKLQYIGIVISKELKITLSLLF
jgi:hypothetical protein